MNRSAADSLLDEDEQAFRSMVRDFMERYAAPLVDEMERTGRPSDELLKKMADQGILGCFAPEEYGGGGGSLMTRAIVAEETARIDAGLDISIFVNVSLVAPHLIRHGTERQKRRYLVPLIEGRAWASMGITEPHGGSDALSPRTTAKWRDGHWVVSGTKIFITNAPIAEFFLIFARTSGHPRQAEGGTLFIIDRDTPGLSVSSPFDKMPMRSSPTGQVFLDDVVVPPENVIGEVGKGFYYMLDGLDLERVLEGGSNLGIAQACLDLALKYSNDRVVFGQRLADYQMTQTKIAAMAAGIEMSRVMYYHLMRRVEAGDKVTRAAAVLKLYSSQMASQAASDTVQILGGYGLMTDFAAERLFRDAKHHEIGAGTSEIQQLIIARETYKQAGMLEPSSKTKNQ